MIDGNNNSKCTIIRELLWKVLLSELDIFK